MAHRPAPTYLDPWMRILHMVHSLNLGGQERLILHLAKEHARRGHEVLVLPLRGGGGLRRAFAPIPIIDLPPPTDAPLARALSLPMPLSIALRPMLRRLRPDVVHTHNPPAFLHGVPAALLARVPRLIHTKHGANLYSDRALLLSRACARLVSAFVAVSEGTAEAARRKERVPRRLLHVIENGIPLADFGPPRDGDALRARDRLRAGLGIPADAFVVGSVGRLSPEKDYPALVRVMAPLLKTGADTHLLLVGEGAARPDIEQAIAAAVPSAARGAVHLTGARDDVPDLLRAMDVFALTSITEGLPLVIAEAMATALPIVATAVGGLPGAVPAAAGRLLPQGDEPGLRAAIAALRDDRLARARMGQAGRAHALHRFALSTMADRYEALYQGQGQDRQAPI